MSYLVLILIWKFKNLKFKNKTDLYNQLFLQAETNHK